LRLVVALDVDEGSLARAEVFGARVALKAGGGRGPLPPELRRA
jgi:hypothetical protein